LSSAPPSTYQPQTTVPEVKFKLTDVLPPSNVYVGREDRLQITSFNSAAGFTIEVHTRLLLPSGIVVPGVQIHVPNSNRTAKTDTFSLAEGFLLSVLVVASAGTAKRGQCYVQLGLARGDNTGPILHQIMIQGYVGTNVNQAWPGNRLEQPTDGPGWIRAYTGTQPGVGLNASEAVPTGARWRLMTGQFTLACSAVAANRYVQIQITSAAGIVLRVPAQVAQTANITAVYFCGSGMPIYVPVGDTKYSVPIPNGMFIPAGGLIGTVTLNIDAGDQWSAPILLLEEWIEP
jgi:hypothetical protein